MGTSPDAVANIFLGLSGYVCQRTYNTQSPILKKLEHSVKRLLQNASEGSQSFVPNYRKVKLQILGKKSQFHLSILYNPPGTSYSTPIFFLLGNGVVSVMSIRVLLSFRPLVFPFMIFTMVAVATSSFNSLYM